MKSVTNLTLTEDPLHILKYGTLSECYKCLSSFGKYNLTGEELNDFRKLLSIVVTRTRSFICTINSSDEFFARVMKSDYEKFLNLVKQRNDTATLDVVNELESLWKAVEIYYTNDNDLIDTKTLKKTVDLKELKAQIQREVEHVESAVQWFKTYEYYRDSYKQQIKVILSKTTNFSSTEIDQMNEFIVETFTLLKSPTDKWKAKLFTYDQKTKCSVLFYYKNYCVDQYGNFHRNEENYLQTLKKFTNFFDFTDHEKKQYKVPLLSNEAFLKMLREDFKRLQMYSTAENFIISVDFMDIIIIIKKMKCYFHFFHALEKIMMEGGRLSISFGQDEIKIIRDEKSFKFQTNEMMDQFDDFKKFFNVQLSKPFEENLLEQEGAVFCLTCGICGAQFIGETKRKAQIRINEHLKALKNPTTKSHARYPLAKHYMTKHKGDDIPEIAIDILVNEVDDAKRKAEKERLIKKRKPQINAENETREVITLETIKKIFEKHLVVKK